MKFASFILAATAAFAMNAAQAGVVTFEGDATGARANGFVSGGVTFRDSNGSGLQIYRGLPNECGNAANACLINMGDDSGGVLMGFDGVYTNLALDFGNDDPGFIAANGLALLRLYLGGVQVGEVGMTVNRDDIMNQTVSYSGTGFDSASFYFTNVSKAPIGLIEVIDNINYGRSSQVPEPSSIALLALALGGLSLARRRARKQ